MKNYYIGIMSGTSLDGIDAVLADVSDEGHVKVLFHTELPMDESLRKTYFLLQKPSENELHLEALAANQLALHYSLVVEKTLKIANLSSTDIQAIGAHGQTIRHQPGFHDGLGYTKQSLNPALLAEKAQIDVIADFRSRDIAAGGQGAPLVPAFHWSQFAQTKAIAILNIGGISNLSLLPSKDDSNGKDSVSGFDCGPGNCLMDSWIHQCLGKTYDHDGNWASTGKVIQPLIDSLLSDPYFQKAPPKSTGRDLFNPEWLDQHLDRSNSKNAKPEDIQASLLMLTAQSIADSLKTHAPQIKELIVCGGGSKNKQLIQTIEKLCPFLDGPIQTTAGFGIDTQAVEAAAFAWLAWTHKVKQPANLPAVTGAKGLRILGAHYPA
jgi:anhydro-N-acetylmuramic acid kinase